MSPLDDELRAMFAARATRVPPAPDPLVGIQARAGRLRRTRLATGVAATALAVSAVAFAVPALTPGPGTAQLAGPPGSPSPSAPAAASPSTGVPSAGSSIGPVPLDSPGPENLIRGWPQRGDRTAGPDEARVVSLFAANFPGATASPRYSPLFAGRTAGGLRYTMGQAWFDGDGVAYDVSYATGGSNGPEFFLGKPTDHKVVTLAFVLCCAPGATRDTLVVIPQPRTGQVFYAPDATTALAPAGEGPGENVDGVVFIDRDPRATNDRLELLDGNGDPDAPTFRGPVLPLLCGFKECG